jgi:nucleoside-diphosphate-sugar epimerase
MRIFITGATGFIGVYLTKLLVQQGHEITVLLRTVSKRNLLPDTVKVIPGDLSIFEDKELQLPPFDVVIHLAGAIFADSDSEYMRLNYRATTDLIKCIRRQKYRLKKFIFASSLAAAGPSALAEVMTEEKKENPTEAYGKAKLAVEKYLDKLHDFPSVSFRPALVFGPGDQNTLHIFRMVRKGFGILINGKAQGLAFVDIEDLLQAFLKVIDTDSEGHRPFFIAYPQRISNKDLYLTIAELMNCKVRMIPVPKALLYSSMLISTGFSKIFGRTNLLDHKQYLQMTNDYVCSADSFCSEYGWAPKHNLRDSISKAYRGYQELGML